MFFSSSTHFFTPFGSKKSKQRRSFFLIEPKFFVRPNVKKSKMHFLTFLKLVSLKKGQVLYSVKKCAEQRGHH